MTETVPEAKMQQLTWGWWLLLLVGVLSMAAGVIILLKPSNSLATLAVIAGIFLLLDGILELASSFMHSTRNRGLAALLGVLSAIVGVLPTATQSVASRRSLLLIGIWLIAVGVIRLATSFDEYGHQGWGWHTFVGAVELLAGIAIVANPEHRLSLAPWSESGSSSTESGWPRSAGGCARPGRKARAPAEAPRPYARGPRTDDRAD